jgi:hypothetical protein
VQSGSPESRAPHYSILCKNRAHCVFRDIAGDEGMSNAPGEDERHPSALGLLVVPHVGEQLIRFRPRAWDQRDPRRQSDACKVPLGAGDIRIACMSESG